MLKFSPQAVHVSGSAVETSDMPEDSWFSFCWRGGASAVLAGVGPVPPRGHRGGATTPPASWHLQEHSQLLPSLNSDPQARPRCVFAQLATDQNLVTLALTSLVAGGRIWEREVAGLCWWKEPLLSSSGCRAGGRGGRADRAQEGPCVAREGLLAQVPSSSRLGPGAAALLFHSLWLPGGFPGPGEVVRCGEVASVKTEKCPTLSV